MHQALSVRLRAHNGAFYGALVILLVLVLQRHKGWAFQLVVSLIQGQRQLVNSVF